MSSRLGRPPSTDRAPQEVVKDAALSFIPATRIADGPNPRLALTGRFVTDGPMFRGSALFPLVHAEEA